MHAKADRVRPVVSLQEFFKDSVTQAMAKYGLAADDHTAYYVVNLLTLFARREALEALDAPSQPGVGIQPLAVLLAAAADAPHRDARNELLRRVGDTSLFVAGFFGDGFPHTLIDIDYYIAVGGAGYGSLSANVRDTATGRAFGAVFAALALKFGDFVDVLAEIRDSGKRAAIDVLRTYEVWLRTGSKRAARQLRDHGIEPNVTLDLAARH